MSRIRGGSPSPAWRAGKVNGTSSASKSRMSYDSPGSLSWREERDDTESVRGGGKTEIPEEKVRKFDALLRRIETEREKIATSGSTTASRQRTISPMRKEKGNPSSVSPVSYDYAARARELRMSLDGVPARSETPRRSSDRDSKERHFAQLARDMTPSRVGHKRRSRSPMKARTSYDGMPSHADSESLSLRHEYSSNTARNTQLRNVRSSSPMPTSSSDQKHAEFMLQVEKFHSSLMSAHDTISTLEKEVKHLKKRVAEKDECILSLERRNKDLNESLAKSQIDVTQIQEEKKTSLSEQSTKHCEEIQKLQTERDGYKKRAEEVDKQSFEFDRKVEEIEKARDKLESSIEDKDNMVSNLRNEIQRLNEELADGSFVRSQALKAEETAKKLEADLEKSRAVIVDLEVISKDKRDEFERELKEKDKAIATLQSEILGDKSMKECSELMKEKACRLETHLEESKLRNGELSVKVDDLEKRLLRAEKKADVKDEQIERLDSALLASKSREKDLARQLEKEQRELTRQRDRLEKYDFDEQETVLALEQAISSLESSHNEEISRLQKENRNLTATLSEAEDYMKTYRRDMNDSKGLKAVVGELQDLNSDLVQQVREKDDQVSDLKDKIESLEMRVESSGTSSRRRILQLENQVSEKEDDIHRLERELSAKRDSTAHESRTSKKLKDLTALYEENAMELEHLRISKGTMQRTIASLEKEYDLLQKEYHEKTTGQNEAKSAWSRVDELEESLKKLQDKLNKAEREATNNPKIKELKSELASNNPKIKELKSELASKDEALAEREEQLADSRKGIAEAQKMIFRLMNTVKELRRKAKQLESSSTKLCMNE
ncbi:hypothetical protein ACHAWF_017329 [Thalassiosira exigua]